ncbi:hypothetical protein BS50DRAFT_615702 [Corynespora cassiicola Philippines]|uniref:DUF3500 domain-containing protein n=1 Tax=Corynespora cassiicola Philippines TaxID=1448308 RepID=A0A2T2PB88_CORCC|nr:hypothetical protein BS50DRAFT_615702 [Corynespora cassiicola Philippines]
MGDSIAPSSLKRSSSFENASAAFRAHIPDLDTPRFTTASKQNIYEYADFFRDNHAPPWLFDLTQAWAKLYEEPFKGVTSDGSVKERLFEIRDEGLEINKVVQAAEGLLGALGEEEKKKIAYPVNAREWRSWSNPEILLRPFGIRLEEVPESTAQAVLSVIEASLSPEGYQKALAAMRINHFLGEVVGLPQIMNKYSYNFLIFGTPSSSPSSPWGWLLYGHHLCLSVFFKGPQVVISPTFTGAEPNIIDDGEWKGTEILHKEGNLGLGLMQSLTPGQQSIAQIFKALRDDGMKQTGDLITDRWNKDDQRHLCGAFRDNRVVPYEGVLVSSFNDKQKSLVLDIANEMLLYLPSKSRQLRLKQIESHFDETYFSWIGGYGDDDAFYYRIQSPVVVLEFDHHSGVFLSNTEPAKFHTHTIVRTPNAGDYGQAIRGPAERI